MDELPKPPRPDEVLEKLLPPFGSDRSREGRRNERIPEAMTPRERGAYELKKGEEKQGRRGPEYEIVIETDRSTVPADYIIKRVVKGTDDVKQKMRAPTLGNLVVKLTQWTDFEVE